MKPAREIKLRHHLEQRTEGVSPVTITIIEWTDGGYSFEVAEPGRRKPFYRSHCHGLPVMSRRGVEHAVRVFEAARAKVRGCTPEELGSGITENRRHETKRMKEQVAGEARDHQLLMKRQRSTIRPDSIDGLKKTA